MLRRPSEPALLTGNLGTGTNLYGFGVFQALALIEALARSRCVHLQLGSYRPSSESVPAVAKEFSYPLRVEGTLSIDATEGVRSEIIAWCLCEVRWKVFAAVRVVVGKRGGHCQERDSEAHSRLNRQSSWRPSIASRNAPSNSRLTS